MDILIARKKRSPPGFFKDDSSKRERSTPLCFDTGGVCSTIPCHQDTKTFTLEVQKITCPGVRKK